MILQNVSCFPSFFVLILTLAYCHLDLSDPVEPVRLVNLAEVKLKLTRDDRVLRQVLIWPVNMTGDLG